MRPVMELLKEHPLNYLFRPPDRAWELVAGL